MFLLHLRSLHSTCKSHFYYRNSGHNLPVTAFITVIPATVHLHRSPKVTKVGQAANKVYSKNLNSLNAPVYGLLPASAAGGCAIGPAAGAAGAATGPADGYWGGGAPA